MKLRYGTRGSPLALAQAKWVATRLAFLHPGLEAEPVIIQTSGDRFALQPPEEASAVGPPSNVKAMFVKEIEEALLDGRVDFAVHSAKDLPATLPAKLVIAAYPEREDPRDVYIGGSAPNWVELKAGDKVATGSARRRIQVRMAAPMVTCVEMRGNVDTRLRKLADGQASGIILARAGLVRLGFSKIMPLEILDVDRMVPAPGQGALAIEAHEDRTEVFNLLRAADHSATRLEVECERAFMKRMGGGCRAPLGALAKLEGDKIRLDWFWADENGLNPQRGSWECGTAPSDFDALADQIARSLGR
ncbi:MAG: hydroxymethylbilane synthase [Elusimicrobia bacterium]|nr:hydroxymethylbilane synthase [Elusimicrobiota bacterium]